MKDCERYTFIEDSGLSVPDKLFILQQHPFASYIGIIDFGVH